MRRYFKKKKKFKTFPWAVRRRRWRLRPPSTSQPCFDRRWAVARGFYSVAFYPPPTVGDTYGRANINLVLPPPRLSSVAFFATPFNYQTAAAVSRTRPPLSEIIRTLVVCVIGFILFFLIPANKAPRYSREPGGFKSVQIRADLNELFCFRIRPTDANNKCTFCAGKSNAVTYSSVVAAVFTCTIPTIFVKIK